MKKKHLVLSLIVTMVLATLGCGVVGASAFSRFEREGSDKGVANTQKPSEDTAFVLSMTDLPTPVPAAIVAQADAEELLLINLYERVNPSVVSLEVVVDEANGSRFILPGPDAPSPDDDDQTPPDEDFGPFNPRGQGSGFVYSADGYIVTNSHVVEEAKAIFVTFYNGLEVRAELVGTDRDSDLAVIRVDVPPDMLLPVSWGDSEEVVVGQRAVAIGNPFGFEGSLTTGIVSGLSRELFSLSGRYRIPDIIQTDAAINPGSSGGPLLNSQGEVIGVTSAIVPRQVGFGERSFLGVGFAVPANLAQRVLPALIDEGEYNHPWLGIQINDVTPEIAQEMGLNKPFGALIVQTLPGTPASKGGLQGGDTEFVTREGFTIRLGGDVIVAMEGEEIRDFSDLISFLSRRGVIDEPITVTVVREGEEMDLEVSPGARPRFDDPTRP